MTEYRKQCLPSKSEAPRSRVKHTRRPHQSGETKVPVRGWVVAIQHINYADPVYHTLRRARMNVTFDSGLGLLSQDRVHKENPFFICEHESSTEEKRFQFYQGVLTLSLDDSLMDTFWKCIRIPNFLMENNPICFDCYGWMTQWITYLSTYISQQNVPRLYALTNKKTNKTKNVPSHKQFSLKSQELLNFFHYFFSRKKYYILLTYTPPG